MRFCGAFRRLEQLSCPKERPETDAVPGQFVHAAFLAIDHADCGLASEAGLSERLNGGHSSPAGGDDVLHEADPLARFEDALEPVVGAVTLRLLADDQER